MVHGKVKTVRVMVFMISSLNAQCVIQGPLQRTSYSFELDELPDRFQDWICNVGIQLRIYLGAVALYL